MEDTANSRAIDAAVSELNGREKVIWSHVKTTDSSYHFITGDDDVWTLMLNDPSNSFPDLGDGYQWVVGPTDSGGVLNFRGSVNFDLSRESSTRARPAIWTRN